MNDYTQELINFLQIYCNLIYESGSIVYPFIKQSKDIDIICVIKDQYSKTEVNKALKDNGYSRRSIRENNIDLHIQEETQANKFLQMVFPWADKYINIIYNPNNVSIPINFLNRADEIKQNIIEYLPTLKETDINYKIFYYIYTTIIMLKNNSYILTEEQINNINILHDRKEKDLEKREELKQFIIQEVESWQLSQI